jgi:hypothetical protein
VQQDERDREFRLGQRRQLRSRRSRDQVMNIAALF